MAPGAFTVHAITRPPAACTRFTFSSSKPPTQQLPKPKSLLELKRAMDAASGATDVGTRLLIALAAFAGEEFDPRPVSESFRKLASQAKDTPIGALCDQAAKQAKDSVSCPDCKGDGQYPCKTCNATGMAPCSNCNGTGNVTAVGGGGGGFGRRGGFFVPCKTCKQKGNVVCPACGGGRIAKCATCNGAKVRKSIPTADFKSFLEASPCKSCSGTGGVFTQALYPCPSCEGLGRFPGK